MTSIILSQCSIKDTILGQDTSHTASTSHTICASLCVKEFREKKGENAKTIANTDTKL